MSAMYFSEIFNEVKYIKRRCSHRIFRPENQKGQVSGDSAIRLSEGI